MANCLWFWVECWGEIEIYVWLFGWSNATILTILLTLLSHSIEQLEIDKSVWLAFFPSINIQLFLIQLLLFDFVFWVKVKYGNDGVHFTIQKFIHPKLRFQLLFVFWFIFCFIIFNLFWRFFALYFHFCQFGLEIQIKTIHFFSLHHHGNKLIQVQQILRWKEFHSYLNLYQDHPDNSGNPGDRDKIELKTIVFAE